MPPARAVVTGQSRRRRDPQGIGKAHYHSRGWPDDAHAHGRSALGAMNCSKQSWVAAQIGFASHAQGRDPVERAAAQWRSSNRGQLGSATWRSAGAVEAFSAGLSVWWTSSSSYGLELIPQTGPPPALTSDLYAVLRSVGARHSAPTPTTAGSLPLGGDWTWRRLRSCASCSAASPNVTCPR